MKLINWGKSELRDVVEDLYNSTGTIGKYPSAEVHEAGYDWNAGGGYRVTEINGTHHEMFEVNKGDAEWMNVGATVQKILELSSKFPGWRHLHVDGFSNVIRFEINGGKYVWKCEHGSSVEEKPQ